MVHKIKNLRNRINVPSGSHQRFLVLEQDAATPLRELGVRLAGSGHFARGYEVAYTSPPNHLALLTLSGEGRLESVDGVNPLLAGLLVVPAGVPMRLRNLSRTPWHFVWFYLRDLPVWSHLHRHGLRVEPEPAAAAPRDLVRALDGFFDATGWAQSQSVLSEDGWLDAKADELAPSTPEGMLYGDLLTLALRRLLSTPLREDAWRVQLQRLWSAVHNEPHHPWRLVELCQLACMSPATLQRRVRESEQTSARQMVIRIRMTIASRLLRQTGYSIQDIAEHVGYADAFVFSSAFRRYTGKSPRAFRQQVTT